MKKPNAPKKTAQEVAVERRQQIMLDKEIEEQEDRFRALSRGKMGKASLLGGAPTTRQEAAGVGGRRSGLGGMSSGGVGGLLGGAGGGGMFGGGATTSGGIKNSRASLVGLQRTFSSMGK